MVWICNFSWELFYTSEINIDFKDTWKLKEKFFFKCLCRPPLWSSGQSSWLQIRFSLRGVHSGLSTIEELFGRNGSGSGLYSSEYGHWDSLRWLRDTLCTQKLALALPTSVGHLVGIALWQTKATEFVMYVIDM
jgi:hypothetical protein